ncbi:MAG: hypothetical protein QOJ29_1172 [Thermoleophilaceae bacterium]|nr:hypothetical protein [Thermoleophilaceae bacterium]
MARGQVVGLTLERLTPEPHGMQILDGGCGLAAKRDGGVGVWVVPGQLAPGTYRYRVTMDGTSCAGRPRLRTGTVTARVTVP